MNRHDFLRRLHARLRPRNYLEIGVNDGRSLSLSTVPTVAIDPGFRITEPLRCDLHLLKATSDDFFALRNPIVHLRSGRNPLRNLRRGRPPFARYLGGTIVDLAFIDGMHLFEFALRDFMNVERFAGWTTVIALDDMLPRNVDEAARARHTTEWTGDVYKLLAVLRELRPDLTLVPLDTEPTGILLVLGADPANDVLRERYDRLLETWVRPDPQDVPATIIGRRGAIAPERFLDSPILAELTGGRRRWRDARRGRDRLRTHAAALLANGR